MRQDDQKLDQIDEEKKDPETDERAETLDLMEDFDLDEVQAEKAEELMDEGLDVKDAVEFAQEEKSV